MLAVARSGPNAPTSKLADATQCQGPVSTIQMGVEKSGHDQWDVPEFHFENVETLVQYMCWNYGLQSRSFLPILMSADFIDDCCCYFLLLFSVLF